ncbi:MAG: NAD(P)-dependent alcohol dehydrogenase [Sphingobium sp.]
MRGIRIGDPGGPATLQVRALPIPPPPGPGEIAVRLAATSLNYHDWRVCSDDSDTFAGRIPMADGAGVVEAIGAGVDEFRVGDRVISVFLPDWQHGRPAFQHMRTIPGDTVDGYACEQVVRPATWFTHAPRDWSLEEAATLPTAALTAWRALMEDGGLQPGATVLALGTGGVSIFALLFARAMGARVILTSSSDAKLERARALGADQVVNYRATPDWGAEVLRLTDGRGADHVIETGGAATLGQSVQAARDGGHIALIGALSGHATEAPISLVMRKHLRLMGVVVGSRAQQQAMVEAIDATGIRPVIDRVFPLKQLAEAFQFERAGGHFGKICIRY